MALYSLMGAPPRHRRREDRVEQESAALNNQLDSEVTADQVRILVDTHYVIAFV